MKKDNIPGLEGYYISRLGTLWSRYHKSGKLTHSEWHKVKPNHNNGNSGKTSVHGKSVEIRHINRNTERKHIPRNRAEKRTGQL